MARYTAPSQPSMPYGGASPLLRSPSGRPRCSEYPPRSVRSCSTRRNHGQVREPWMVDRAGGLDQLFSPGDRLKGLDTSAEPPRIGGDGGGDVQIAVVGGPPKRGAQIGQFDGEPVEGLPLAGAVPKGDDVGFASGEVARSGRPGSQMLHHRRRVAPRRTGGSSPASKTGSAPPTGRRPAATCAPARPADRGWRIRLCHRIRRPRRRFLGRIRPANTEHRSSSAFSASSSRS